MSWRFRKDRQDIRTFWLLASLFELTVEVKERFKPIWRNPEYVRKERRRAAVEGVLRWVLTLLSLGIVIFLFTPGEGGLSRAISLQLAMGDPSAILLFEVMGALLVYLAVRAVLWRAYGISAGCLGALLGLYVVAHSNPYSLGHLAAFVLLVLAMAVGQVLLANHTETKELVVSAFGTMLGGFVCFLNIGFGERMIILCNLYAIRAMYLDLADLRQYLF